VAVYVRAVECFDSFHAAFLGSHAWVVGWGRNALGEPCGAWYTLAGNEKIRMACARCMWPRHAMAVLAHPKPSAHRRRACAARGAQESPPGCGRAAVACRDETVRGGRRQLFAGGGSAAEWSRASPRGHCHPDSGRPSYLFCHTRAAQRQREVVRANARRVQRTARRCGAGAGDAATGMPGGQRRRRARAQRLPGACR